MQQQLPSTEIDERRLQTRFNVDCEIVAISASSEGNFVEPIIVRARAEDVSRGGCRLITVQPFASARLWVRFIDSPELTDLTECQVVRMATPDAREDEKYEYGLRFRQPLSDSQLQHLLSAVVR